MAVKIPSYPLPKGEIPAIGLGTWQSAPGEVAKAVTIALKAGYTHIDAASIYGNEKEVGEGIKESGVSRDSIWITTKLWNTAHRPKDVLPAFEKSLSDLGLDYVDLYLMHYPCALDPDAEGLKVIDVPFTDTWAEMEKLVESGRARNIGISNFSKSELETLLKVAKIKPAVHQLERHPYLPHDGFLKLHKELGIHISAYSPLGNTNPLYASSDTLAPLVSHPVIVSLAEKYKATPAQVLINWSVTQGCSVLPKSTTEARILENFKLIPLSEEDAKSINVSVTERKRYCDFSEVIGYHYYADLGELEK